MQGYFITFEGGEGAGKSTQIKSLAKILNEEGYDVVITREPGGTSGAEAIRYLLLSGKAENFGPIIEAALFAAARIDHMDELIIPSLKNGKIVLCDRFIDSTRVYQGQSGMVPDTVLSSLEETAILGCKPDLTFVLDLPAEVGMKRADNRRGEDQKADRFEKDNLQTQELRRQAFLDIAKHNMDRCIIVDATKSPDHIAKNIADISLKSIREKHNG